MRRPRPPFLELSFYIDHGSEAGSFAELTDLLLRTGARFSGEALVHRAEGARERPFAAVTDLEASEETVPPGQGLNGLLVDPDARVLALGLPGAAGGEGDVLTYIAVSPEAAGTDRHALAIWTDDVVFSEMPAPGSEAGTAEARRAIYERFKQIVGALRPAYAAITVEEGLRSPHDLRSDPRTLAFTDFFVSGDMVHRIGPKAIETLYRGAYQEPLAGGLYISRTGGLNPLGQSAPDPSAWRESTEMARAIGESAR